ncbi:hypothetical protein MVI01_67620 [Myxococcus virescens]|uniref:Uncharacterized protein n=1 Tax=Myxococcus virescens TaxID=83456 RepID=A0A511HN14_9BACT|nr:hypothetical protein MVI01_67620 [Myxococcus virescens]SDE64986.1 hypothetical protein SAMN04488504_109269 [Myxococcus virescens]
MAPVLEDHSNNPIRGVPLRLREQHWQRLEAIARTVNRSRNDIIEQMLTWAEEQWHREQPQEKRDSYQQHLEDVKKEAVHAAPAPSRPRSSKRKS